MKNKLKSKEPKSIYPLSAIDQTQRAAVKYKALGHVLMVDVNAVDWQHKNDVYKYYQEHGLGVAGIEKIEQKVGQLENPATQLPKHIFNVIGNISNLGIKQQSIVLSQMSDLVVHSQWAVYFCSLSDLTAARIIL